MRGDRLATIALLGLTSTLAGRPDPAAPPIRTADEIQYLVLPVKIDDVYDIDASRLYDLIDGAVADLVSRVGSTGDGRYRQLAFAVQIPAWVVEDLYPGRAPMILHTALQVAVARGVALHVVIESHYFWHTRPDLWNFFDPSYAGYDPKNSENVEWSDWAGTAYRARYLDWGQPQQLPPHMCYACPKIRSEVERLGRDVFGPHIKAVIDGFAEAGRPDLFSGITITSEPAVDNYSVVDQAAPNLAKFMDGLHAPKVRLGYNSLTRAGYGASHPPADFATALGEINRQFASDWAHAFIDAGIPPSKLYTHVAAPAGVPGWPAYDYFNAPLSAAFADGARPGWTTYPVGPIATGLGPIYAELARHGNPPWASTEASPGFGNEIDPYEYLRWHFDHGAVLLMMNTGATDPSLTDALTQAVWGAAAVAAYERFLTEASARVPALPPPARGRKPAVVGR